MCDLINTGPLETFSHKSLECHGLFDRFINGRVLFGSEHETALIAFLASERWSPLVIRLKAGGQSRPHARLDLWASDRSFSG